MPKNDNNNTSSHNKPDNDKKNTYSGKGRKGKKLKRRSTHYDVETDSSSSTEFEHTEHSRSKTGASNSIFVKNDKKPSKYGKVYLKGQNTRSACINKSYNESAVENGQDDSLDVKEEQAANTLVELSNRQQQNYYTQLPSDEVIRKMLTCNICETEVNLERVKKCLRTIIENPVLLENFYECAGYNNNETQLYGTNYVRTSNQDHNTDYKNDAVAVYNNETKQRQKKNTTRGNLKHACSSDYKSTGSKNDSKRKPQHEFNLGHAHLYYSAETKNLLQLAGISELEKSIREKKAKKGNAALLTKNHSKAIGTKRDNKMSGTNKIDETNCTKYEDFENSGTFGDALKPHACVYANCQKRFKNKSAMSYHIGHHHFSRKEDVRKLQKHCMQTGDYDNSEDSDEDKKYKKSKNNKK